VRTRRRCHTRRWAPLLRTWVEQIAARDSCRRQRCAVKQIRLSSDGQAAGWSQARPNTVPDLLEDLRRRGAADCNQCR